MSARHRWCASIYICLALLMAMPVLAADSDSESGSESSSADREKLFSPLKYRYIGPIGNRVSAVVGVPGDVNTYYAGAASGGIFKSTDGGHEWLPIFDDTPASAIGSLAVAPSDANVVWAGTGETFIRSNVSIGNGIYRSTDRGKTWQHAGLDATGRIGRIIIHPKDPMIVWAAALGHAYGPQPERGVYKTTDGGNSWRQVLFVDENTGASDLVIDPNNPRILFAGMWQIEMSTFGRTSGGPGSGLYASRDGGETWKKLEGKGLPKPPLGKIGLTMSAADSNRVYALIETNSNSDFEPVEDFQGVLWRSDDGGDSWRMISADNNLAQRPLYYSRALAAPDDADEVHFMAVQQSLSLDGGVSIQRNNSGWDHHDIWIDPLQPQRLITGHDGGVSISTNSGKNWYRPQLPIAQMYHVEVDRQVPYNVYGNRQDGSTYRGPSNTLSGGEIPLGAWQTVGGCEVGFTLPDPEDPSIIWSGCYDGILERYDDRTGHSRNISVWPEAPESWPAEDLRYRFQWTFPMAISPHDSQRVYVGSQFVHQTTDGGQSWQVISPDLTTDDPELQRRTGGLTLDDAGPTVGPTVFALVESPLEAGQIWAGTNDGLVQLSRDGGQNWTDLTANLPGLPKHGTVSNIEPSRHHLGTAYLTVDRHQLGDTRPYVYRTADFGATWTKIIDGIPESVFSYAHCVREDPVRPGLLFLGTENGLYMSHDDGGTWQPMQSNLPPAPVHWLVIQDHFHDLVVGTYGRGFWILDDITPLRHIEEFGDQATLLSPRSSYRLRRREPIVSQPNVPAAGKNPQPGSVLHYYLPTEADKVELTILDADGEVVQELEKLKKTAGLHRVLWNERYELTSQVKLRTAPLENSKVPMPEKGWRGLSDGGRMRLFAPPGEYTVRLTVGDTVVEQKLQLLKDPGSEGTVEDLKQQFSIAQQLRDLVERSAGMINEIEWLRKQLVDLQARLAKQEGEAVDQVAEAAESLELELQKLEGAFFDLRLTGARQDTLRWRRLLYAKLTHLAGAVQRSDHRPTDSQIAVFEQLEAALETHEEQYRDLQSGSLAAFNQLLNDQSLAGILLLQ